MSFRRLARRLHCIWSRRMECMCRIRSKSCSIYGDDAGRGGVLMYEVGPACTCMYCPVPTLPSLTYTYMYIHTSLTCRQMRATVPGESVPPAVRVVRGRGRKVYRFMVGLVWCWNFTSVMVIIQGEIRALLEAIRRADE
jgi:hypothetical protein